MTNKRKPYMAANWKMNKTTSEAASYVSELVPLVEGEDVDVVVCAPFTALPASLAAASGSKVKVFAQNMHEQEAGAFTGEVSATMLADIGIQGVVLGHSERRQYFNELDSSLRLKIPNALERGLEPILCVGESEEEREAGDTQRRLRQQVQEDLSRVADDQLVKVVIAYEPIWAIGSGKAATPDDAQSAISFIRALVGDRNPKAAKLVRVLYGGSVKPDNAKEIMAQPDIDGALVGGAGLEPQSFSEIVKAAV